MRKIVTISLASVAGLVLLAFVIGLFLPATYRIERDTVINASPAQVHEFVDDLNRWPEWGPWQDEDPTIVTTVGEISSGAGAHQTWVGDSGTGELTFTSSDPRSGVEYDLSFDEGQFRCVAAISYTPLAQGTRVSWIMEGDMGNNIIGRYFALRMDDMVGPMFETGMNNLKTSVEAAN